MRLSEHAIDFLAGLSFDPDAARMSSVIPLAGIFWADELQIEKVRALEDHDRSAIFRLFGIRQKIWTGNPLSSDEQELWDSALEGLPGWPLFKRLSISSEDREAQRAAELSAEAFSQMLRSDADEFVSRPDGSFSATFDLTKDESDAEGYRQRSWLRTIKSWLRLS